MRRLLELLGNQRRLLFAAFGLATVNQSLLLVEPQFMRILVDKYVMRAAQLDAQQFFRGSLELVGAAILVATLARVARKYQESSSEIAAQRVSAHLYCDSIGHALLLPFRTLEDRSSGDLIQKFERARTDAADGVKKLVTIYLGGLAFVIVTAYAFYVHWAIGTVYIVLVLLMSAFILVTGSPIRRRQKEIGRQTAALAGSATEKLRNAEIVKSLGLERQEIERIHAATEAILQLTERKIRLVRIFGLAEGTAAHLCRAAILLCMLWLVFRREISTGEFITLFLYSQSVFAPLAELEAITTRYQEAKATFEHVEEIRALPVERTAGGRNLTSLSRVTLEGVSLRYEGVPVLENIDLDLREGETVAIVGESGAGKSSIAKLLVGLYPPSHGHLRWNGVDSREVNIDDVRRRVSLVTHETQLFNGSLRENLLFARAGASDRDCLDALAGAAAMSIPRNGKGLDTRIGEGGLMLSGGERQRIAIARALIRDPELIIFDEATSNLDSITERAIASTIADVSRHGAGRITVLIAHRLSSVAHADRIVTLARGRIVETGTHATLLESGNLYAQIWRQQSRVFVGL